MSRTPGLLSAKEWLWPPSPEEAGLTFFRARLLHVAMVLGNLLLGLAFIPSILVLSRSSSWILIATLCGLMVVSLSLLLARRLPYKFKAWAVGALLYLTGMSIILFRGPYSVGALWLFLFTLALAAYLGRRGALAGVALNTVTLLAVFLAIRHGMLHQWLLDSENWQDWPIALLTFTLLTSLGSVTIAYLLDAMEASLEEQRTAYREMTASQKRYKGILDNNIDLICTHDLEGRLTSVSRSACEAFHLKTEDLVGQPITLFLSPEYRDRYQDYLEQVLSQGHAQGVARVPTRAGGLRFLEYRNRLVEEEGQAPYVIGTARDITEKIAAEKERERLREELAQAKRLESLGFLAGGIAHDFNNILAITLGYSEAAMLGLRQGRMSQDDLAPILEASLRGKDLVKRILEFSRQQADELKPVPINKIVAAIQEILQHTLPKTISIQVRPDSDSPLIMADSSRLEQVLMNLATNAADAMPEGGSLVFETGQETLDLESCQGHPELAPGCYVYIKVADSGQGMTREVVEHIFDPFFTTKEVGKGTGLGLASVYGMVKAHKGHIACQSEVGRGTTFTIRLPALSVELPDEAPEPGQPSADLSGSETILIVEDEQPIAQMLARTMKASGYQVLGASNGAEALRCYQDHGQDIDLVVMDLNMPVMDGHQAIQEILALDPGALILVASGYPSGDHAAKDGSAGVAGYVHKPFTAAQLLARVRQVLDSADA